MCPPHSQRPKSIPASCWKEKTLERVILDQPTSGLFMAAVPFFCASSGSASLFSFVFRTTVTNFAFIKHPPQQVLLLSVNGTSL